MSAKKKLLWHSNSPWASTGYGVQTGLFTPPLQEHYDIAVSAFYGLEAARLTWNGVPVFPGLGGEYGSDYLGRHAAHHFGGDQRDGLVMTLLDVWVLDPKMAAALNMACWVPVDHEPVPPRVLEFFQQSGAMPIAMSRFGEEQLAQYELDPVYVPHAVDATAFRPYDRHEVRKLVGVPQDAFLVGMVAANKGRPSRKGFQQAFEAFRIFREKHDEALLYLHTVMDPNVSMGEELHSLARSLGIPMDSIMVADQYRMLFDPYPPEAMAKIYSTMDVLLNPSMGEGFGIPILEAQACGVPVIVTNFSAMPEVGKAGWQVACRKHWTGQQSWQATPDVEDIVESMRHCYSLSKNSRKYLSEEARKHALEYALPKVMEEHMLPALKAAEERFRLGDREKVAA